MKPNTRPASPNFSSGPCTKRPGWTPSVLTDATIGRSHRSAAGKAKLKAVIDRTRAVLQVPEDYRTGIVPASDTGAMELAMWSLLGTRPVDMLSWESFGETWIADVAKQLKLGDVRQIKAPYGQLADLSAVDPDHDVVFTWNGTTSGVRVPNGDWIAADRRGLTICDATSAAFAMDLPWPKLDVTTYSWQKVLGGEAAHGMLILSPRAVERLESTVPPWPMPKIFRLTAGGKLNEAIFRGETINTPSMLCVEDALDSLDWARRVGGLPALMARSQSNFAVIERWVTRTPWVDFLAQVPATRSCTSVCLIFVDPWFNGLATERQKAVVKELAGRLEAEGVAFDIANHMNAPAGLRIWAGATVETADLEALCPWLDWAWGTIREAAAA
ncbi:MAG TPA: phosphoserine transaminase [Stellaceae bacterium]|nr:phosphoserine transaminase [Stellaceae bacterium]